MIAVLADDFTGAAEIGATGRRYGLAAEVHTTVQVRAEAELVVIDTNTRSSTREEAARRVAEEAGRLCERGFDWLYKKVDSVLRGHVVEELARLLDLSGLERALLVPVNPSFGQVIRRGHYWIDGRRLHETRFADDPEHPAVTSDVLELLGRSDSVRLAYCEDARGLPDTGIIVSGVSSSDDLLALAKHLDDRTLAAGAAEFFGAFLEARLGLERASSSAGDLGTDGLSAGTTLIVLGSVTEPSRSMIARARETGIPVVAMPIVASADPDATVSAWADATLDRLAAHQHVVVSADIMEAGALGRMPVQMISYTLASLTEAVLHRWRGDLQLLVAGGTTASMIVRRLGWHALRVIGEPAPGVVTLAVTNGRRRGQSMTVKPGSYPWPEPILRALK